MSIDFSSQDATPAVEAVEAAQPSLFRRALDVMGDRCRGDADLWVPVGMLALAVGVFGFGYRGHADFDTAKARTVQLRDDLKDHGVNSALDPTNATRYWYCDPSSDHMIYVDVFADHENRTDFPGVCDAPAPK